MLEDKINAHDYLKIQYRERVLPSAGTFAPTVAVFPAVLLALYPISPPLGVALGAMLTAAVMVTLFARSPKIQVAGGMLQVGKASISVELISEVKVVSKNESFSERGPKLDARSFYVFQGSVKTALKVYIVDPQDPTPYWLFSTRNPDQLRKILRELKA
jgi:hypothetical protein